MNVYEQILMDKRGYVSRWPEEKSAVLIISGGLDSVIMADRLMDQGFTLYPLHIERGQTNYKAERNSIETYTKIFEERHPGKFNKTTYIKLNVPPTEFKANLSEYTKQKGHPLRDTMLQMAAVQYALSLQSQGVRIRTVFCAVMPEDYFPHSNLTSIRATNVAVCQNTDDWEWLISSPNIDSYLEETPIDKPTEIAWAKEHSLPVEHTVSCNVAVPETNNLNCGDCSSCTRRKEAFAKAGVQDATPYYSDEVRHDT
jgi:7-cyano-7-deazaguanine synthase